MAIQTISLLQLKLVLQLRLRARVENIPPFRPNFIFTSNYVTRNSLILNNGCLQERSPFFEKGQKKPQSYSPKFTFSKKTIE